MSKLYAGTAPNLKQIPFKDLVYTQKVYDPDFITFKSRYGIAQGKDIRLGGNFPTFGGKITNREESPGAFTYEAVDYSTLLRGKIRAGFNDKTSSYILKKVLKYLGLRTGGVKNTKKKHTALIFEETRALDLCYQIMNLEKNNMEFYINSNGIAVFKKEPSQYQGIVLKPGNFMNSSVSVDSSKIITGVRVYGSKDSKKLLYNYNNKKLSAKYGNIIDLIVNDKITTKSTAKAYAKQLFKKNARSEIVASVIIPALSEYKKLKPGQWMVLKDTNNVVRRYFIEEIKNTSTTRQLKLMSQKTPQPESWTYKAPNSNDNTNCKTSSTQIVKPPTKVKGSCSHCSHKPAEQNSFQNICPIKGCKGKLKFNYGHSGSKKYNYSKKDAPEGQFTCDPNNGGCGADYCAKCGSEKMKKSRGTLKKASSTGSCKVDGVASTIVAKAQELGTAKKIFNWVNTNIKYKFYEHDKKTDLQTFNSKVGNCYDQAQLLVAMLKCIGVSAKVSNSTICGKYRHRNVIASVNGRTIVMDPTCSKPKNRVTGSWTQ